MMLEQMFEGFRRAWVSSFHVQQEMFNDYGQQWAQKVHKRWLAFTAESLSRHREAIDATYKALIQIVGHVSRLSDLKTPGDYRRVSDDIRHTLFDTFKDQSEAQLRDIQRSANKWFEVIPSA